MTRLQRGRGFVLDLDLDLSLSLRLSLSLWILEDDEVERGNSSHLQAVVAKFYFSGRRYFELPVLELQLVLD